MSITTFTSLSDLQTKRIAGLTEAEDALKEDSIYTKIGLTDTVIAFKKEWLDAEINANAVGILTASVTNLPGIATAQYKEFGVPTP
tara:strand:+ start:205 stop:462 length:258 start_codon:yes stop_codon:yes gene_type:complete